MPTPTGKPRVGESIFTSDGKLLGKVTRRSDGDGYSVWVNFVTPPPGKRNPVIITEFEYWKKLRKWEIK